MAPLLSPRRIAGRCHALFGLGGNEMDTDEIREQMHQAAGHEGHGAANKRVALIIAVLAALLAITELGANKASVGASTLNVATNDVWAFYQAKTLRSSMANSFADMLADLTDPAMAPERKAAVQAHIDGLRAEARRLNSDPVKNEGRAELMAHAQQMEAQRDVKLDALEAFELATAFLQLAVVLASAGLLTSVSWLIGGAVALGFLACGLDAVGFFVPELVGHLM